MQRIITTLVNNPVDVKLKKVMVTINKLMKNLAEEHQIEEIKFLSN